MKKVFGLIFFLSMLSFLTFCKRIEAEKKENGMQVKEVSLPLRLIKAKTQNTDTSNFLVLRGVSELMSKHEGIQKPIISFEYDDKWVVSYKIKSDKTFDIYIVEKQSNKDVRAKMLITTKKEEPTAVISALMIAYDSYVEKPGKIEIEEWEAAIKEDLSLKVLKTYNVYSSGEKNEFIDINELSATKKNKNEVEEFYQIEEDGAIVFVENVVFSKPEVVQPILNYRAIIAFKKIDENFEDVNDEWMLNIAELEIVCQKYDIIFIQHYDDFSEVVIRDSDGTTKDTVNIRYFTANTSMGYLLLHSRKKAEYVSFQSIKSVLESISNYFNIDVFEEVP